MNKSAFPLLTLLVVLISFAGNTLYGLDLMLLDGRIIKNCRVESMSNQSVTVVVYGSNGKKEVLNVALSGISENMQSMCRAALNEQLLKEKFLAIGEKLEKDFRKNRTGSSYRRNVLNAAGDIMNLLEKSAEDITVEKILELSGGVLVRVIEVQENSSLVPGECILICNIEAPEEDLFRCTVYNIFSVTDLDDYGVVKMYDLDIESAAVAIRNLLALQAGNEELFYPMKSSANSSKIVTFDPETELEYISTEHGMTVIFVERGNRSRRVNIIRRGSSKHHRHPPAKHVKKPHKNGKVVPGKNIRPGKSVPRVPARNKTGRGGSIRSGKGNQGKPLPNARNPQYGGSTQPGGKQKINKRGRSGGRYPNLPVHKHPGSTRPSRKPSPLKKPIIRKEESPRYPNLPEHLYPGSTRPNQRNERRRR